jgi:hypothetical protein
MAGMMQFIYSDPKPTRAVWNLQVQTVTGCAELRSLASWLPVASWRVTQRKAGGLMLSRLDDNRA